MSARNWKREYEQSLRVEPPRGRATQDAPGELRRHARLQPAGISFWVGVTPGLHLIALSARTLEFYTERRMEPGQALSVRIDEAPALEAEVVACQMEETDPALLEVRYRVRCRIRSTQSA
jgi:hypothetical protein